ncbi:MAG: universal stress protein [Georgfuchsia sp.]
MRNVLLAVDGSEYSDRAVHFVVEFVKQHGTIEIHVANVEPAPVEWQTHGLEEKTVEAHLKSVARHAMKSAQEILRSAEIPFHTHFSEGDVARALVQLADKLGCDAIVMGTRGLGAVSNIALGSVTSKLLHLTHLPVVCVK